MMMTTMMMAMMMTIMMTMMMTMMTMMTIMPLLMMMAMMTMMMTDAPKAEASQTARHQPTQVELLMANVEECGKSIKAIINGMSSTDVLQTFGPLLLEGAAFEDCREPLQRALQRALAPAGAVDDQHVAAAMELPSGEQFEDSDQSSSASSLTSSYPGR